MDGACGGPGEGGSVPGAAADPGAVAPATPTPLRTRTGPAGPRWALSWAPGGGTERPGPSTAADGTEMSMGLGLGMG